MIPRLGASQLSIVWEELLERPIGVLPPEVRVGEVGRDGFEGHGRQDATEMNFRLAPL